VKLRDFRIGLRLLLAEPGYSLVSILGLAVGIAVCLLLLGFARYSWQYNAHVPDVDRLYIAKERHNVDLGSPVFDTVPVGLREVAKSVPGVAASSYLNWFPLTIETDGRLQRLRSLTALPDLAAILGLEAVRGSLDEALSRPDGLALTEAAAMRLFGTTNVLGKVVELRLDAVDETRCLARIAAILPTPPANTTIPYEALHGVNLALIPDFMRTQALVGDQGWPGNLLVRLPAGVAPDVVAKAMEAAVDGSPWVKNIPPEIKQRLGGRKFMEFSLSPLREAYFDRELAPHPFSLQVERGDAGAVRGLVAIAILVLLVAAINYVNLATIRVIRRQREIAMRKVLGAASGRLLRQFIAESLLVAALATVVGLLLAALALPVFAQLMNRDLAGVFTPGNATAAVGTGVFVGLVTAIYPAWIATRVRPARVLAGRPNAESRGARRLRQWLSVVQVATAMGLVSYTLAVAAQTRFAIGTPPGFDASGILVFELPVGATVRNNPKALGLITALTQDPAVASVAVLNDSVGRSQYKWSTAIQREGREPIYIDVKTVSPTFFMQYGITAQAGRMFDPSIDRDYDENVLVINAIAARKLGFGTAGEAVGQSLQFRAGDGKLLFKRIVGVAPEVRFYSMRQAPDAVAYELFDGGTLSVRARVSPAAAERAILVHGAKYFPNAVLEVIPAQAINTAMYTEDLRLAKLLALATAVAVLIAAIGAYALTANALQRRAREIALRKLFGARRREVARLVAREIGMLLLIAAAIGLPVAALAIARYLAPFTEHTPLAYWMLALALLAMAVTTAVAALRHAWAAIRVRPAMALRGR
jgi:putative ABC transport system permease protein